MGIIKAILSGERDPVKLAKFRDPRCKSSEATIARALPKSSRVGPGQGIDLEKERCKIGAI